MSLMLEPLRKFAVFEGRARRSEYWLFALFQLLVTAGFFIIASVAYGTTSGRQDGPVAILVGLFTLLALLFFIALIIPALAVTVRRLHDTDKSGWWLLISFIPFGSFVILIFTLLDSTPGPNRYGEDPKGRPGPPGAGPVIHNHYYAATPATPDQPTIIS
ncbi:MULTISPECIES: DUF805 domain-containing protein [Caulobacter]|jgi:uncharacterized membrane protein YhaH (DUF805 family)|uniref:Putative membrane protein n=1 Tax=Caulobacter vibrioides OR37 TaxID=1292034 RepID=R0D5B3_CAUVI|nr:MULTISPECIES: DUF805 domain-containing protein [Caulobacter]ENZ83736.1 putative membrane protein [Caulobacter vibrioides OR37]MBQ1563545.1 DUF805 domain-containing protein [Caulobacter sp.]HXH47314.1 DUF805 domain-containing protein [Bradyrhizobium sp.]